MRKIFSINSPYAAVPPLKAMTTFITENQLWCVYAAWTIKYCSLRSQKEMQFSSLKGHIMQNTSNFLPVFFFFFLTAAYLLSVRWQLQGADVKEKEEDGTIIKE